MSSESNDENPFASSLFRHMVDQVESYHLRGLLLLELSPKDIILEGGELFLRPHKLIRIGDCIRPDRTMLSYRKQNRAPEYRRACLNGKNYYPQPTGDIYSLIVCLYHFLLKRDIPLNFQLDRNWTKDLYSYFQCETNEKKTALQSLFDQCTSISEFSRISNCRQLKETNEYKMLFGR